jgi:hypothetical protein
VTQEGIEDAKHMTLSNMLLSDQRRRSLMAFPQHEAILGVTHASKMKEPTGPLKQFNSHQDVLNAWRRGEIGLSDHVEVVGEGKKAAESGDDRLLESALCWFSADDA